MKAERSVTARTEHRTYVEHGRRQRATSEPAYGSTANEDSRSYWKLALGYGAFISASAFGIVLLLLGLFGAFFIGLGLVVVLGLAAMIAIPVGMVTSFVRGRKSEQRYVTNGASTANPAAVEVGSGFELARWDLSEILAGAYSFNAVEFSGMGIASDPTVGTTTTQSEEEPMPPAIYTNERIVIPKDVVIAAMFPEDAKEAAADLLRQGFMDSHVKIFPPSQGPSLLDRDVPPEEPDLSGDHKGTGKRDIRGFVRRALRVAVVEEDPWLQLYEEERREGKAVLLVHVLNRQMADAAASILAQHHAHLVKFFGRWQFVDFPTEQAVVADVAAATGVRPALADLQGMDLLQGLAPQDLEKVAALCQVISVPHGTVLARQGDEGRDVFMVMRGEVERTAHASQGEVTVRIAGAGESFPLAALLESGPLITSAVAMSSELQVARMPCQALVDLCESEPRIGLLVYRSIAQILGGRYRATLDRLTGALDKTLQKMLRQADLFANV